MKLTKDDLVLGLTKLHDDIQKFANECRINGFQKEYVKLFDAQAIVASLWDDLYKEQNFEIKSSTVYSDSFDEMIQKDFTYKGNKYTWNDIDCVYYNDNGDEEDFFMEIPEGAITSSKKPIKSDYTPDYSSRVFKGARFKNRTTGAICEIVRVEPENNYVLYKFNDKFPKDTTIDGIIALLKHNNYYPITSNTPGKVIREEKRQRWLYCSTCRT